MVPEPAVARAAADGDVKGAIRRWRPVWTGASADSQAMTKKAEDGDEAAERDCRANRTSRLSAPESEENLAEATLTELNDD